MITDKMMKELEKYFIKVEESNMSNPTPEFIYGVFGEVEITTPTEILKFPLVYSTNSKDITHAGMIMTTSGEYLICFNIDIANQALTNVEFTDNLYSISAHEVGHYLAGHFGKDTSHLNVLNINTQDQLLDMSEYNKTKHNKHYKSYMRCVLHSLMKGGYNLLELEADIQSLKFITLTELISCHTQTMHETNIFAKLEKLNRIKHLTNLVEKEPINREGYSIKISAKNPKPDSPSEE